MTQPILPRPAAPRRWWSHKAAGVQAPMRSRASSNTGGSAQSARLLLVNQHYWPDHASTAQHLTDLAEALAEQGHEVHVVCSRGASRPGSPARKRKEVHNGVTIHRVGASSLGRRSVLRRMCDYLSFHLGATIKALRLRRPDLVITLTTPPLIALIGYLLRCLRGSRHVYWSMDLHPDASIALGLMNRRRRSVRFFVWLSDLLYRKADQVVALGPYMEDRLIAKGVSPRRLCVIPVWGRRDEAESAPSSIRQSLGLKDEYLFMYSGNHGLAHSFDEILEAARRLKHRPDIHFVFVGDGPRLREVVDAKALFGLNQVHLLDFVPRAALQESLAEADAHVVTLRQEMTGICVPSKVYGAMSVARPLVFVGPEHCEAADTLRAADCGLTVRPGDVDGLVAALERLANDRPSSRQMGERGLSTFSAEFEREACCARWCWLVGELARGETNAPRVQQDRQDRAALPTVERATVAH